MCRMLTTLREIIVMMSSLCVLLGILTGLTEGLEVLDPPVVDYSRHKVLRVFPSNEQQLEYVTNLASSPQHWKEVKLWSEPMLVGGSVDLHVSPNFYTRVTSLLAQRNIRYTVLIEDLQQLILQQQRESELYRRRKRQRDVARSRQRRSLDELDEPLINNITSDRDYRVLTESVEGPPPREDVTEADIRSFIDNYASYDEIADWLLLVKQYRPKIVQLEILTRSYEGLPLYLIKIGKPREDGREKPAVFIDAGVHAREWISPATSIYFIYALVSGYETDEKVTELIENFDWYILPLLNPDGYEYSRTTDRMWRKTRSRTTKYRPCQGVDGNRNFDFQWRSDCRPGRVCRGRNPCDDVFAGRQPFSEPEMIGLANWIMSNRQRVKLYLSLHSYSQLWLVPWGYTTEHPVDHSDLIKNARKAVNALQSVSNTRYRIGSPAEILYIATGGSYDWVKGVAGIKYSYTVELRDTGSYGFLLPRSQIIPTGRETWAGVVKLVEEIKKDSCWMNPTTCE